MSLSLEQKKAVVREVTDSLSTANAAVLAEYRGLSVSQMASLRREARKADVFLRVVKNTLARRVVEGSQFECLKGHFVGPVAVAASADPVAVAKVVSDFAKDNRQLKITVGAVNGAVLNVDQVQALAKLPSREELLAKLLGTLQAPVQKFVQTLNEIPSKFVRTLGAVKDSKEAS